MQFGLYKSQRGPQKRLGELQTSWQSGKPNRGKKKLDAITHRTFKMIKKNPGQNSRKLSIFAFLRIKSGRKLNAFVTVIFLIPHLCNQSRKIKKKYSNSFPPFVHPHVFSLAFPSPNHLSRITLTLTNPSHSSNYKRPFTNPIVNQSQASTGLIFLIISNLPISILNPLLDTFNNLLAAGEFPDAWREFLVFFIPKSTAGKFRPISLASCLLKLLESLIQTRLIQWLESHTMLSASQFGFRKSKSCLDNLSILTSEIYNVFASQQYTACIFVDVAGAFDNVDRGNLMLQLRDMGLPWSWCKFVFNLTSSRSLFFKIADKTLGLYFASKGVPQGCILSPLLYILYTNELDKHLHPRSNCVLFADDIAIFSRASHLPDCIVSIQSSLDAVSSYLKARGLSVEPSKSDLVIFSRKVFNPAPPSVQINSVPVSGSLQAKFLGITLDFRLTWHPHLSNILSKLKKLINIIKCLRTTWWGANPAFLITVYRALMRSIIEYGSSVIPLQQHPLFKKIEVIQRKALRLPTGFRNSTPNNVVLAETGEPLLQHHL